MNTRLARLFTAVLCALALAAPAAAQVLPSALTPLSPCRFFDSRSGAPLPASSTTYLLVRGSCNIPQTANAIAATLVALGASSGGHVTVWESSSFLPAASSMNFRGNGIDSSFTIARLCYPLEECAAEDLAVHVSGAATHFIIDIVGYFEPLTE